jgi:hypothetical protein
VPTISSLGNPQPGTGRNVKKSYPRRNTKKPLITTVRAELWVKRKKKTKNALALRDINERAAGQRLQLRRGQTENRIGCSPGSPNRLEGFEIGIEQHLWLDPVTDRRHPADRITGHFAYVVGIRAFDFLSKESSDFLFVDSIYSRRHNQHGGTALAPEHE